MDGGARASTRSGSPSTTSSTTASRWTRPSLAAAAAAAHAPRCASGWPPPSCPFTTRCGWPSSSPSIDIISRGRLDVGVGRGNRPGGVHRLPTCRSRRTASASTRPATSSCKAWTEDRFAHAGPLLHHRAERAVIPKPWRQPHPPIYQVCGSDDGIESSAARGWPMLNSILAGPVGPARRAGATATSPRCGKHGRDEAEIATLMKDWGVSRQIYVAATDAQALAEAKDAEMWYQDSLRRFQVPERIEDAHRASSRAFGPAAERFAEGHVGRPGRARRWPSARPIPCAAPHRDHARRWASATCSAG